MAAKKKKPTFNWESSVFGREDKKNEFIEKWEKAEGYEKGQTAQFWIDLLTMLRDEYMSGSNEIKALSPTSMISFEERVNVGHTKFIDGYITYSKVLIEQKNASVELDELLPQSNGELLTPYEQAKEYAVSLPYTKRPRWIILCNFREFRFYDQEVLGSETIFRLYDLNKPEVMDFFRDVLMEPSMESKQVILERKVSYEAGTFIGKLYDELYSCTVEYNRSEWVSGRRINMIMSEDQSYAINLFCVRLAFLFYAEDSSVFGKNRIFCNYVFGTGDWHDRPLSEVRKRIKEVFAVLEMSEDTSERMRVFDLTEDDELLKFPYVDGGLFKPVYGYTEDGKPKDIELPPLSYEFVEIIRSTRIKFNWADISPAVFGAMFESTLNPEQRKKGGMHYTSVENIHKVIDPLFLDDLVVELTEILKESVEITKVEKLEAFRDKLGEVVCLDPACGSGNFLTETYMSLRKLENIAIKELMELGGTNRKSRVKLNQFYGIEINELACQVAKTALWIAEAKMYDEERRVAGVMSRFLPFGENSNILCANALRVDWDTCFEGIESLKARGLKYIIGNPPFVGAKKLTINQRNDILSVFGDYVAIDYVCAWFYKAIKYIQSTNIDVCLVSTDSIFRGITVLEFWNNYVVLPELKANIIYSYEFFNWESDSVDSASVSVGVVAFRSGVVPQPILYTHNGKEYVPCINWYNSATPNVAIIRWRYPIVKFMPKVYVGAQTTDGDILKFDEIFYNNLVNKYPQIRSCLLPYVDANTLLRGKRLYRLFIANDEDLDVAMSCEEIRELFDKVRSYRSSSSFSSLEPWKYVDNVSYSRGFLLFRSLADSYLNEHMVIGVLNSKSFVGNSFFITDDVSDELYALLNSKVYYRWVKLINGLQYGSILSNNAYSWNSFPAVLDSSFAESGCHIRDIIESESNNRTFEEVCKTETMSQSLKYALAENDVIVNKAYGISGLCSDQVLDSVLVERYLELTKGKFSS